MNTPTQLVWTAHGAPELPECSAACGVCYVCCGPVERGQPVKDWLKTSYTDQNRARNPLATHVCEACVYVHSRTAPVLGRPAKDGKKFGGNFRNYSHLYEAGWCSAEDADRLLRPTDVDAKDFAERLADHEQRVESFRTSPGYANASKGEKPLMREFLRRNHGGIWFAAIADSGQKHVLPFAPMNGPGRSGVVLFDETRVVVPESLALVDAMAELLTAGATKDEIERGDYRSATWKRRKPEVITFESEHGSARGAAWFALSLWLAQRNEEAVAARLAAEKEEKKRDRRTGKGKAAHRNRGDAPRDAKRVPADGAGERSEALGDSPKPSKGRRENVRNSRGMGHKATARSTDPVTGQGRLPGFD